MNIRASWGITPSHYKYIVMSPLFYRHLSQLISLYSRLIRRYAQSRRARCVVVPIFSDCPDHSTEAAWRVQMNIPTHQKHLLWSILAPHMDRRRRTTRPRTKIDVIRRRAHTTHPRNNSVLLANFLHARARERWGERIESMSELVFSFSL